MPCETLALRMIRRNDIGLDRPLPGHLRDIHGSVLISKGEIFNQQAHERLGKRVLYVGPDWPQLASDNQDNKPQEVIDALADQRGEEVVLDNRRRHVRHAWQIQLNLRVRDPVPDSLPRQIHVTTLEVSAGGFAFAYERYLHVGTYVVVCFDMLPHRPILRGEVRSCVVMSGTKHRIGVKFIDYDPAKKKKRALS